MSRIASTKISISTYFDFTVTARRLRARLFFLFRSAYQLQGYLVKRVWNYFVLMCICIYIYMDIRWGRSPRKSRASFPVFSVLRMKIHVRDIILVAH